MKLNNETLLKELEGLKKYLNSTLVHENGVYSLSMDSSKGTGSMKGINFNRCMTTITYDLNLISDLVLPLNFAKGNMMYFLYCLEGQCLININNKDGKISLNPLQTAVIRDQGDKNIELLIKNDRRFLLNVIAINKTLYHKNFKENFHGLDGELNQLIRSFDKIDKTYHLGRYNLEIGEYVKQLQDQKEVNDISSFLQYEGLSNLILAKQIIQFYGDKNNCANTTGLNSSELETIGEVSDFIRNYPEVQHSIKSLSARSSMSPNKLQEGFKFMHGRTVSDYIRSIRIEKAAHLIKNTDMNISEVVYTIGLTSRSYFCKIFKNKYHCSPKQYKNNASIAYFKSA